MATRARVSYSDFKDEIDAALVRNAARASADKNDDLKENEIEYRIAVGKIAKSFKSKKFNDYANKIDEKWHVWIRDIKTEVGEEIWKTIKTISSTKIDNLENPGTTRTEFAYAIHYRLHRELSYPKFAKKIDELVFGASYEAEYHTLVFEDLPDALLAPSFPRNIRLGSTYQTGRKEFEETKATLLTATEKSVAFSAAIHGAGGYGKTAIAEEICLDEDIKAAFPGGIYWLQFGLVESDAKENQQQVYTLKDAVSGMLRSQYKPDVALVLDLHTDEAALKSLIEGLDEVPALLIADDLWTHTQARWISSLPDHISVLATTRAKRLRSKFAETIEIKRLSEDASYQLMANGMSDLTAAQCTQLKFITKSFGGWPLLLRLANSTFKLRFENGNSIETILNSFEEFTTFQDITGWDNVEVGADAEQKRRKFVEHCIDAGLAALPGTTYRTALLSMGVFPDDTSIPFSVISDYWQELTKDNGGSDRIRKTKSETIRETLHSLSFFRDYDPEAETLQIHDVFLAYFRHSHATAKLSNLHGELVASMGLHCPTGWHELPSQHGYGWQHLLYHLDHSGQSDVANALRTDFQWIRTQLRHAGLAELQRSFLSGNSDYEAAIVGRAINRSANVLRRRPSALAHQLFGRLLSAQSDRIAEIVAATKKDDDFWPKPDRPHLRLLDRELLRITGHEDSIGNVAINSDEDKLVTTSSDGSARLWNPVTGIPLTEPLQHDSWVTSATFSAQGDKVATASLDQTARIWDASTGAPLVEPLRHALPVLSVAFDAQGHRVVTASSDWTARVWDVATGLPLTGPLQHEGVVYSATFNAQGDRIVSASADHTARIWNAATGAPITKPFLHDGEVKSAVFNAQGDRVVSASLDHTARIWDTATGVQLAKSLLHKDIVLSASFNTRGNLVVTASADHTAQVWDAATGVPLGKPLRHKNSVGNAIFNAQGDQVVTTSFDGTARVWDSATGEPITEPLRHEDSVYSAIFNARGDKVVTASQDGTARIWDVAKWASFTEPLEHRGMVAEVAFNTEGNQAVIFSKDCTIRVWDAVADTPLSEPFPYKAALTSLAFNTQGNRVVTASYDGTVRIWDAATGKSITEPLRHEGWVSRATFNTQGDRIVSASVDHTARIWDAATGAPITKPLLHENVVTRAVFSPQGDRVVTVCLDYTARIWDAATGAPSTEPLKHGHWVDCAVFNAQGDKIVTGCSDGSAQIWQASTGNPLSEPLWHDGPVDSAAFNAQGDKLVTLSRDGCVRIWNTAKGVLHIGPLRHEKSVSCLALNATDDRIATASNDRTVWIWDTLSGQLLSAVDFDFSIISMAWCGTHLVISFSDGHFNMLDTKLSMLS